MSNLQKLESDSEVEVVPHTPATWNNWRTESSRGQLLRDILANGHSSLPNGESFDEEKARKFVEQEFARRGRKRQARPVIPASPEAPREASPLQPRASVRRSERSVAPNLTVELPQSSHSGQNLSPGRWSQESSTAIIERVKPRPEKQHHSPRRDDKIPDSPLPTRYDSPSGRALRSPSPLRHRHQSSSLPVRTPFPSLPRRRRNLSPCPSPSGVLSSSPPAKAIRPDSGEQCPKDTERENANFEQQAVGRGYSPEKAKNIAEDRFGFNQVSYALEASMEQRGSCSEELSPKDVKPIASEEYWTKLGYQPPPPGTDLGTRQVHLTEWVAKYGLHINLRTYIGGGGRGSSGYQGYGRGPSTSYSGMQGNHSSYQQYGPEPPMGIQYSSGSMENVVVERGDLQSDEIIDRLADDIRELRRRMEEERRDDKQRREEERRDSEERWEKFKHELDELDESIGFRSK